MNLTYLEQDVIELLIFQPRCACELAEDLNREVFLIEGILGSMKDRDLVHGEECGEFLDKASQIIEDDHGLWAYSNAPVSEFFSYALTKGKQDGLQGFA